MTRGYQPGSESAQGPTSKRAESPRPGSVREQRALPFYFTDLHVHHRLPGLGNFWGRWVHGFQLDLGDSDIVGPNPSQGRETSPLLAAAPRIFGLACYETYLVSPRAARERLLAGLEGLAVPLLRSAGDLQITTQISGSRKTKFFLAVESLRFLENAGDLSRLWELGVRSIQPIHFLDTQWGGSSREGFLPDSGRGISDLGREMLAEMDRLGFILDVAHMNRKTAEDCLSIYRGSVMCSHTGLAEEKPVRRNLDSDLAGEIFRRRGVVGVTCWRHLLGGVSADEIRSVTGRLPADLRQSKVTNPSRLAWTLAYCRTVAALAKSNSSARIAIGSDRGAPIQAPPWFFSQTNLEVMRVMLSESCGWDAERFQAFLGGHACEFLGESLPE